MKITDSVIYVGVDDKKIDLFEGMYIVPNGISYNSYVVISDKIAVMDAVDINFTDEWLQNIKNVLGDKKPDYLVVQHMEPDHSASIDIFLNAYPEAVVVSSQKAFAMMKNFFGTDYEGRKIIVGEGDKLDLGDRNLNFVSAPMVHWPEVIVTYDDKDKILFSADGFGKFGALDTEEDWACEARRYYVGIVGKFGKPVQTLLKKAAALDINIICPLHGPVLSEDLGYYINLYDIWSSYGIEREGVVINYTSVYGNTRKAVEYLAEKLREYGCPKVAVNDLARCDMAEAIEDTFSYGKIVLATTTYNGSVFPFMKTFMNSIVDRLFQNRKIAIIENGSWAPTAGKVLRDMLESCKDITLAENNVTIMSALTEENKAQLDALAKELVG